MVKSGHLTIDSIAIGPKRIGQKDGGSSPGVALLIKLNEPQEVKTDDD